MMPFALPASVLPAPPKKAKPIAAAPVVALPLLRDPVDASAVKERADRFRCEPYNAVLLASACVARQERAARQQKQSNGPGTGRLNAERQAMRLGCDYVKCVGCPVGPAVAVAIEREDLRSGRVQHGVCAGCGGPRTGNLSVRCAACITKADRLARFSKLGRAKTSRAS